MFGANIKPFYNAAGGGGGSTPPATNTTTTAFTGGAWTFTKTAETGVAETIITLKVSDDAFSYLQFANGSVSDGLFVPRIYAYNADSTLGLDINAYAGDDSGTAPIIRIGSDAGGTTTRPALHFAHNGTVYAEVSGKGAWTFTKPGETPSVAEAIVTFRISDDATGKLDVMNQITTDSVFVPMLRGTGPSTRNALHIRAAGTTDSGSNALMVLDARIGVSTAVATRPPFSFTNAGTQVLGITAAGGLDISGGTTPSLKVGTSGTAITQIRTYSQTIDPASVAANTTAEQTFTVTGLTTADKVFVNKPTNTAGLGIVNVRVSAADTLAITFGNFTGLAIDAGSETYTITAIRS